MRYLIVLEQTETGFAVQVPDLAIVTYGETIEDAKCAAADAIWTNLEAYKEAGMAVPDRRPVSEHLENPDFDDLLFTYVSISERMEKTAA